MNTAEKTILFLSVRCFLDPLTRLVRVEWIFLSWFLAVASKIGSIHFNVKLRAVACSKHDDSGQNKLEMTRDEKLARKYGNDIFLWRVSFWRKIGLEDRKSRHF